MQIILDCFNSLHLFKFIILFYCNLRTNWFKSVALHLKVYFIQKHNNWEEIGQQGGFFKQPMLENTIKGTVPKLKISYISSEL